MHGYDCMDLDYGRAKIIGMGSTYLVILGIMRMPWMSLLELRCKRFSIQDHDLISCIIIVSPIARLSAYISKL